MAIEDISQLPPRVKARFEQNAVPGLADECWPWRGYLNDKGYGIMSFHIAGTGKRGKPGAIRAHRYALIASGRPVVPGMRVLHSCDNPSCVNPDHLRWGTQAENCADIVARDRQPKGEAKSLSKLTEDKVREIRASQLPHSALALRYGVCEATIGAIRSGKKWRHVI